MTLQKSIFFRVFICALFILYQGCASTEKMTRPTQLADSLTTEPSTVLTKDGVLYKLSNYQLRDSLLYGKGWLEKNWRTQRFGGKIRISDIDYFKENSNSNTGKWNTGKTLLALGIVVTFGTMAALYLSKGKNGLVLQERHGYYSPPSGDDGWGWVSCPFIYSFDGNQYYLESETFAGAVFKGAERVNYDNLYHLKPLNGKYQLKLTNESKETQFVNEIKLLIVDSPSNVKVIPDNKGKLHTIYQPVFPIDCVDVKGKDVLNAVLKKDSIWWESDLGLKDFTKDEDLKDGLVLQFQKPIGSKLAKLVVNGTNTSLGVFAFEQIFNLKGDNLLRWYQQLEKDTGERRKFINWMMKEGMLHVKVWQDSEWVEQTSLLDVGPNITKDQLAVLDLSRVSSEMVKIKLESATDLWKIDQVYLDYSPDASIEVKEIAPVTAIDESDKDVAVLLVEDDSLYYTTILGQYADLTFNEIPLKTNLKRSYIVKSKGYYYQWLGSSGEEQTAVLDSMFTVPLYGSKKYLASWREVKGE